MTKLQDEFQRVGWPKYENDFDAALSLFINAGGTFDRAIAIVEARRASMPGGGHPDYAQQGQVHVAPARQPNASGEGQIRGAQEGHDPVAPSARSPMTEGGQRQDVGNDQMVTAPLRHPIASGQIESAQQGQTHSAARDLASGKAKPAMPNRATSVVPPAREPSAADLEAMKEASDLTYFEMIKLRGKAWTQYRFKQLKNVRSLNMRENALIAEVIDYQRANRISDDHFIHLSIPSPEMKKMVRRIETAIEAKAELMVRKAKKGRRSNG